jgi:hypothetical protein
MMKAAGYHHNIVKADTLAARVYTRAGAVDKDLIKLLDRTSTTVALSFDRWTSLNHLSMLAINGTWAGPDMMVYKACFDFIEVKCSHSGENLAYCVYKQCKQLNILHKIITLTSDNASNNDTAACYLYKKLSYLYDDHLEENPICGRSMRFQGKESKIDCLAHIDNLIVKAMLKELGSSTHKEAVEFLDRVKDRGWKEITLPLTAGDIAVLRIVVLWINRSP